MSAAGPSTVSTGAKEFSSFRLDTVNECLWRHGDAATLTQSGLIAGKQLTVHYRNM